LNITQWLQQQATQDAADGCFDSEARHLEAAREIERLTDSNERLQTQCVDMADRIHRFREAANKARDQ